LGEESRPKSQEGRVVEGDYAIGRDLLSNQLDLIRFDGQVASVVDHAA